MAVGCVAYDSFDRALVTAALADGAKTGGVRMLLQTATFMESAIALYSSFGFRPCPPFRSAPPAVALEVFLAREF